MRNKFLSFVTYFRSLSYQKRITIVSSLVLVITLPTLLFVISQQENISSKADVTIVTEAESGTVSGNAVIKTSDQASGEKYILLNASTSTQPPTPTTYKAPTPTPTKWPPTPTLRPLATLTPRPTLRPTAIPTSRPTSTPIPTPTPAHGNGNGKGNQQ